MSVAWLGTYSAAGLAALENASAIYEANVRTGYWNKTVDKEGSKDVKMSKSSMKYKTVDIDGLKMTYKQAYTTNQLLKQGGNAQAQKSLKAVAKGKTGDATKQNYMNIRKGNGVSYMGVRYSSPQGVGKTAPKGKQYSTPKRITQKQTSQYKTTNKAMRNLRNSQSSVRKEYKNQGNKYNQKVERKMTAVRRAGKEVTGQKTYSPRKSSIRSTRKGSNRGSSRKKTRGRR